MGSVPNLPLGGAVAKRRARCPKQMLGYSVHGRVINANRAQQHRPVQERNGTAALRQHA